LYAPHAGQCQWFDSKLAHVCLASEPSVVESGVLAEGGFALASGEVWEQRIEAATTVTATSNMWLGGDMILNPERFKSWGLTPVGAMGQVTWLWDEELGPPPASDLPNHKSAIEHAAKLGAQLDEAAAMGMIEYYDPQLHGPREDFAHNILPLGARMKPSGSVRMLVDPSLPGVNAHMLTLPCNLPSAEDIFKRVKPHSVLGKRDLLNGFFHLVLAPEARRYMAFKHPVTNKLARWIVLPQGTKQSPALFCEVSEAAAKIFNRIFELSNIKAFVDVYVDDFIIDAENHTEMVKAFDAMDEEAAKLGLTFNPDKDIGKDQALTSIEVLGLIIDAPAQELRLPDDKRQKYLTEVQTFSAAYQQQASAPRKAVESLVGKLLYACRVCRWGYLFLQAVLDELYPPAVDPPKQIALSDEVWADLDFWAQVLDKDQGKWLGIRKHMIGRREVDIDPSKFAQELFTDASITYGGGGVFGSEVYSLQWESDKRSEHIGTLELEALARCLHHWKHDLAQQTVLARMDNVQAVCAVNKGASRKPALRPILLRIALLGLEYGFEVKAKHVKGVDNPADEPSRGRKKTTSSDWTFRHFAQFNNPPAEVDCCAAESGYNVQRGCTVWFSAARPVQEHTDQLVGKVLWANPPFQQIASILYTIVAAWQRDPINTVATVLVPEWPEAGWYRQYLRRKRPIFKVLHRFPANSKLFYWKNSKIPAPATKFPMLIIRLGSGTKAKPS